MSGISVLAFSLLRDVALTCVGRALLGTAQFPDGHFLSQTGVSVVSN